MSIGSNLRRLRLDANMTQQEVAKRMRVHFTAVSQWENDRVLPRMGKIDELALLFRCSRADIINDTDPYYSKFEYYWKSMSDEGREAALAMLDGLSNLYPRVS